MRHNRSQRPRRSPTASLSTCCVDLYGVPGITSSPGRKRCLGDWFKRWETTSDPGGDNRDPARWSAIKCRHEDRAQPVVIDTRSSIFLLFFTSSLPPRRRPLSWNPSITRLETMKTVFRFALLCVAVILVATQDLQEQERPKTFRRLIPADVLRGELTWADSF